MASFFLAALLAATASPDPVLARLDATYEAIEQPHEDLHRTPELSLQEARTAAKLADRLRTLGFERFGVPTRAASW
jgi:metal-dependent amidase/aminoacylase/carboxypeptidase family protein